MIRKELFSAPFSLTVLHNRGVKPVTLIFVAVRKYYAFIPGSFKEIH